ncbi:hypothetical protein GCM10009609_33530 [Pseudonocardia aurantiaca]|uniref:Uncharacterized protein n=1 Tax=Pseudonocardia aurantiaca TaxID=75290 RepID=A0ABW4FT44_9PSEU
MTTLEIAPKVSRGAYELSYHEAGSGPVLVMLHGSGPGVSEERTDRALAPGAIDRTRNVFASLAIPSAHGPMWTRTGQIPHRTLVTWGRDDRMLPLEGAFFATRRMPNADLHIFSQCGHWAQVERKAAFEALVRDFLTAV